MSLGSTRAAQLAEWFGTADERSEWQIVERRFEPARVPAAESLFAVGNGYVGVRGAPDEGTPAHAPGIVLNGFHETWPIVYPEDAYGLARTGQTLVDVTDGSIVRLLVDGEPFDLATARIEAFERVLDMRRGVLVRTVVAELPGGRRVRVRSRRLASLAVRELVAFDYEVTLLDRGGAVTLSSELLTHAPRGEAHDPRAGRGFAADALLPIAASAAGGRATLRLGTRASGLELACGMTHALDCAAPATFETSAAGDAARVTVQTQLGAGERLRLSKFVAYHWAPRERTACLGAGVERTLDRAWRQGFNAVERAHRRKVAAFWRHADVVIEGAPELQRAVRFNLFQLLQATARVEGLGVPAKGVTGRGYEGHYFWDTEIYVLPFLIHTAPQRARRLLSFRCAMLDAARTRAREVGHRGALYPWRTIDGREASAWYAAGTAQYHINADIAYAMHHYNRVTGDLEFMLRHGAEVLVETARFWIELGFHDQRRGGAFCINAVTGPDEYTTVVDNNAYTNLMAKENLEVAIRVVEWLQAREPAAYRRLAQATGLVEAELAAWRCAAAVMYVPRHDELGIVLQDEHFLGRKRWDFEATPADKRPLLLHYHPLELYRHQVIKQTDVVLATYLVGHQFDAEEKQRTFDYYDPLTTGDSTLSACIQSVIASEVGYADVALEYFLDACAVDLLDRHGNTADGIHIASAGGTWLALVAGFGGLRDADGDIRLHPRLPAAWSRLRFRLHVRGQLLEVDMTKLATTYRLLEGTGLLIWHFGEPLRLAPGGALSLPVHDRATSAAEELPRAA
jgi:alpha,alpha-trehalose phosphorylase